MEIQINGNRSDDNSKDTKNRDNYKQISNTNKEINYDWGKIMEEESVINMEICKISTETIKLKLLNENW